MCVFCTADLQVDEGVVSSVSWLSRDLKVSSVWRQHSCRLPAGEVTFWGVIFLRCRLRRVTTMRHKCSLLWRGVSQRSWESFLLNACRTLLTLSTWLIALGASFPGRILVIHTSVIIFVPERHLTSVFFEIVTQARHRECVNGGTCLN